MKNFPFLQKIFPPELPRSPINVDAAENNTRPPQGGTHWAEPHPPIYGSLSGFWRLQDVLIYRGAFRTPRYGPGTTGADIVAPTAVGVWGRNMQAQSVVPNFNKYTFG